MTETFDPDVTSRRTYTTGSGSRIFAERKDPYGFIEIYMEAGKVPEFLTGNFTSYDEADKRIQLYLSWKDRVAVEVTHSNKDEKKKVA